MSTEDNNQGAVNEPTNVEGDESQVQDTSNDNQVVMSREERDKLNETVGSLKREIKQLKKQSEAKQETPEKTKEMDDQSQRLVEKVERMTLKSAQITHEDDVELARKTADKWGMDIDELVEDEDFNMKLERQRTERANRDATSNVKGDGTGESPKNTPDYWIAKGQPPTPDQVPDRKTRAKITRAMMKDAKGGGKKFYND